MSSISLSDAVTELANYIDGLGTFSSYRKQTQADVNHYVASMYRQRFYPADTTDVCEGNTLPTQIARPGDTFVPLDTDSMVTLQRVADEYQKAGKQDVTAYMTELIVTELGN